MTEDQPASTLWTKNQQTEKIWIFKNVAIISFSFLMSFTAFTGTVNLQSSLHSNEELGNKALTALNLGAIISNLFLSVPAARTLGLKWSLIVSLFMHTTFPMSNFYPTWYILYLGAFITGLGAGPLWSVKSTYLTNFGEQYSKLVHETSEASISRIFGIFFMIYHVSHLSGNVISSSILQRSSTAVTSTPQDILSNVCGANYCYRNDSLKNINQSYLQSDFILKNITAKFHNRYSYHVNDSLLHTYDYGDYKSLYTPSSSQIYLLFGIYLVCDILACLLAISVADLKTGSTVNYTKSIWSLMIALFLHMKNPKQVMLFPMAFFSGVSYAFITADYCLGFVTCTFGIENVGFVMATFGTIAGLGSVIFGPLLKYIGRRIIFVFGAILNTSVLVIMVKWTPSSKTNFVLYIFAGLWGISHAIWTSQLIAFIGFLFNDNQHLAFTVNYLWQIVGNCLWHIFSIYLCVNTQVYVMISMIVVSMLGYASVEFLIHNFTEKRI